MGILNNLTKKAEQLAKQHPDQLKKGLDQVAKLANKQTGGKYSAKIDKGVAKAEGALGLDKRKRPRARPDERPH